MSAERRLAAIVAVDVVGYSRLMGEDETETLQVLRAHRAELIDPLISKHNGHIVKTMGDGLLLEFRSVVDAVACALEVQRAMIERNSEVPADRRVEFRVGINIGDVIIEEGDVFGDGVNIAARLEQFAKPGGICLSEDAFRQIRGKLEVEALDAGEQRLKNIASPIRVYRIDPTSNAPSRRRVGRLGTHRFHGIRITILGGAMIIVMFAALAFWFAMGLDAERSRQAQEVAPEESTAVHDIPLVAVLPFANQTGDEGQDYFADGITEEVINSLGRFHTLRVIGRNAIFPYRKLSATQTEVASELGARYLVDGSVRRSDSRVRISAHVTDAVVGTVLWSDNYDGEITDTFQFQDSIAHQIAGTLAASITRIEARQRLDTPRPAHNAFDLVLRARAIGHETSRTANRQFRELVTAAIEIDPRYATAHALLAEGLYSQALLGWTEFADRELTRAEDSARRAITLAPDQPDGHRALGRIHLIRGEYVQARNTLRQAIGINPSDSNALAVWGLVRCYDGEINGGIEALELALEHGPF